MAPHFSFMAFYTSITVTFLFYSYAASDDNTNSWQPVLQNMRMRSGDYQRGIADEIACKTRCVEDPACTGVDWHTGHSSCFHFYDSDVSPFSSNGYRHWRLIRNRSTSVINQATSKAQSSSARISTSTVTFRQTMHSVKSSSRRSFEADNEDIKRGGDDDIRSTWQPVQLNTRAETLGHFQRQASSEASCKDLCVQNSTCVGIDWHNSKVMALCFLLYDCNVSLENEIGYDHWEIRRYKSTPVTCQDVVGRAEAEAQLHSPVSLPRDSTGNLSTVVRTLSALLGVATVIVAALVCNTWRLHQKIRSCTCEVQKVNFTYKAQENGYQTYNGPDSVNQPTAYTEIVMVRTLPPIPCDSEILYADIDDDLHV